MKRPLRLKRKTFAYPYMAFMVIFLIVPLVLILINAFIDDGALSINNFAAFFSDGDGLKILSNSLVIGFLTTIICLLLGFPVAYILSKYYPSSKSLALLFIIPMWINFLIRTLATKEIFVALDVKLGMGTVIIGMIYNYLPFMILPLHTTLTGLDKSYFEAAQDLGCDGATTFARVVLPLSVPGIVSGVTMVFIPTISTFAISQILSNRQIMLFGDSINHWFEQNEYGIGSVMSLIMLLLVIISNLFMNRFSDEVNQPEGVLL